MQSKRVWARAVGVDRRVVIESIDVDEIDDSIVVAFRLRKGAKLRCGQRERRSGRYDHGERRRRWRAQDAGTGSPMGSPRAWSRSRATAEVITGLR